MNPVCTRTIDRLAEYLAGDLDERAAAEMRAHLESCASCRTEEREMAPLLALLARDAAVDGGVKDPGERYWADFASRVSSRRGAVAPPRSRGRTWGARLAWAASIAVVLGVASRAPVLEEVSSESAAAEDLFAEELSLEELAVEELAHVEERLLAADGGKKKAAPQPTATPVKPKRPPLIVEEDAPGDVYDDLADVEDLSEEELRELMKRIEAIRT